MKFEATVSRHVQSFRTEGTRSYTKNSWRNLYDQKRLSSSDVGALRERTSGRGCRVRRTITLFHRENLAGEVGSFIAVSYSKVRPSLNSRTDDDSLRILALTKAEDWKYEDEMRMLMPLANADRIFDGSCHLIDVPTTAVQQVTLGCRSAPA